MNLSNISFDISDLDLTQDKHVLNALENKGTKGVWLSENNVADAFVQIASAFSSTKRIRFGTLVSGIFGRTPMIASLATVSLLNLTSGRFVLGLGTQTKNSVKFWYGKDFVEPITQMCEFVDISHRLLGGSNVTYNGKYFSVKDLRLPGSSYLGKIFVAAIGPKMIQLAGEIADGIIGTFWTPSYIEEIVVPNLKIGADRASRSLEGFEILCVHECFPTGGSITYDSIKPHLVSVAAVPMFKPIFQAAGYLDEYRAINSSLMKGDVEQALSVVTHEMVKDLEIAGDKFQIKTRLEELFRAGLTEIVLHPYRGNLFSEYYSDQFRIDITKYNGKPIFSGPSSVMEIVELLR